jgi:hypothetical protein
MCHHRAIIKTGLSKPMLLRQSRPSRASPDELPEEASSRYEVARAVADNRQVDVGAEVWTQIDYPIINEILRENLDAVDGDIEFADALDQAKRQIPLVVEIEC